MLASKKRGSTGGFGACGSKREQSLKLKPLQVPKVLNAALEFLEHQIDNDHKEPNKETQFQSCRLFTEVSPAAQIIGTAAQAPNWDRPQAIWGQLDLSMGLTRRSRLD